MTSEIPAKPQGDKLLWMLGAGVGLIAVVFFTFLNMGAPEAPAPMTTLTSTAPAEPPAAAAAVPEPDDFSVRLNRARLAMDAGMLTEPEGYSAWSIYSAILDDDASNAAAGEGLELVAARLIDQAFDALNAGRRDSAADLAERVLGRFPAHAEAAEILERAREVIVADGAVPEAAPALPDSPQPQRASAPPRTASATAPAPEPPAEPEPEPVDPIIEIYSGFTRALAAGVLRGPAADNAADLLIAMRSTDADHAMTRDAEQQLFDALFARHNEAFNRLDSSAALEWLEAASELGIDTQRVAAARDQILDFAAAERATQPVTAAELTVRSYVPPEYPAVALRRGLEGWVDVAFVLSREGETMSVEAIDESNSIFRGAATRAVEQWEFEPHVIHERVVEQHAQTRIRFVLED